MGRRSLKAQVYLTFCVPFLFTHSRVCIAFKIYLATEECSTYVQDYQIDLLGLKNVPALGRCARLSASPLDYENEVVRTVRGRSKYTLALNPHLCAAVTPRLGNKHNMKRLTQTERFSTTMFIGSLSSGADKAKINKMFWVLNLYLA